jgi:hypothetical protein
MKMKLLLAGITRSVNYLPELVPIIGTVSATLLFCQLAHWMGKGKDPNGWIYKKSKELQKETGLTKDQQETARRLLKRMDLIEEKRKGIPPIVHFRIKIGTLTQRWEEYEIKRGDSPQLQEKKMASRAETNPRQQSAAFSAHIPESTHKNTQKITSEMNHLSDHEERRREAYLKIGRSQNTKFEPIGDILNKPRSV